MDSRLSIHLQIRRELFCRHVLSHYSERHMRLEGAKIESMVRRVHAQLVLVVLNDENDGNTCRPG